MEALQARVLVCSSMIVHLLRTDLPRLPAALRPALLQSEELAALDILLDTLLFIHVQVRWGKCGMAGQRGACKRGGRGTGKGDGHGHGGRGRGRAKERNGDGHGHGHGHGHGYG